MGRGGVAGQGGYHVCEGWGWRGTGSSKEWLVQGHETPMQLGPAISRYPRVWGTNLVWPPGPGVAEPRNWRPVLAKVLVQATSGD